LQVVNDRPECFGGLSEEISPVKISRPILIVFLLMPALNGCVGTVVGAAVDVTIEAAKIPFKVAGAVVDLATDDEKEE